jgi:hypothetical protein
LIIDISFYIDIITPLFIDADAITLMPLILLIIAIIVTPPLRH